jgi:hypothetical protein
MKGTIVKCLEEMVTARFGVEKWKAILVKSGRPETAVFTTIEEVEDGEVLKMLGAASEVLGVTATEAMEAFGEHWSTIYAPSLYGVYFDKAKNTRELLLSVDQIHVAMTEKAGAKPPRFTYGWKTERDLVMTYSSHRGLVALMPSLVRGVAKYYKEEVDVSLQGNDVRIKFPA